MITKIYNILKNFSSSLTLISLILVTSFWYLYHNDLFNYYGGFHAEDHIAKDIMHTFASNISEVLMFFSWIFFIIVAIIFVYEKIFHKTNLSSKIFAIYAIFQFFSLFWMYHLIYSKYFYPSILLYFV